MEFMNRSWRKIHPRNFIYAWGLYHFALAIESYFPVSFVQAMRIQVSINSKEFFKLLGIVLIKILNKSKDF